jgi:predicted nucleotidyltransferase
MEVRSVEAIVCALNSAGIRYLIVGGLAVNAHGFERMTKDVDMVIQLAESNCRRALRALIEIGYQLAIPETPESFANQETREMWRRDKNMIVLKLWSDAHRRTPIDIFVYEPFSFDEEYSRSVPVEIADGVSTRIVSLPTLLSMKREAGRPQDLQDITELERCQRITHEED